MNMTVRSKVVKIGNSRGIRIPKTLLEQADKNFANYELAKVLVSICGDK